MSSSRSQPLLRQQACYPEEPRHTGDPGLGSQQPGGPLMAPSVATATQWELMQTQGRPQAYQQHQGGSVSQHSSGEPRVNLHSMFFNLCSCL